MAVANMVPASLGHRPPALLAEVDLAGNAAPRGPREQLAVLQEAAEVPTWRLLQRAILLLTL